MQSASTPSGLVDSQGRPVASAKRLVGSRPPPRNALWQRRHAGQNGVGNPWNERAAIQECVGHVYAAVKAKANRFSALDYWVERYQGRRRRSQGEPIEHEVLELLDRPNPYMTGAQLRERTVYHYELAGNAYWAIQRDQTRKPVALWSLRPDAVRAIPGQRRLLAGWRFEPGGGGKPVNLRASDVVHIKQIAPDDLIYGWSTLRGAAFQANASRQLNAFQEKYFENSARPDYAVTTDEDFALGEDVEGAALADLQALVEIHHQGVENAWLPLFLPKGTDVKVLGFSMQDMAFTALADLTREDIFEIFGVSSFIVSRGLQNVNKAVAWAALYLFNLLTIKPLDRSITDQITCQLIEPNYPTVAGVRVRLVSENPVPVDAEHLKALIESFVDRGIWTADEARQAEGMFTAPLEGGDVPLVSADKIPRADAAKGLITQSRIGKSDGDRALEALLAHAVRAAEPDRAEPVVDEPTPVDEPEAPPRTIPEADRERCERQLARNLDVLLRSQRERVLAGLDEQLDVLRGRFEGHSRVAVLKVTREAIRKCEYSELLGRAFDAQHERQVAERLIGQALGPVAAQVKDDTELRDWLASGPAELAQAFVCRLEEPLGRAVAGVVEDDLDDVAAAVRGAYGSTTEVAQLSAGWLVRAVAPDIELEAAA